MKKRTKTQKTNNDKMRSEYDFSGGIRGKHFHALQTGYTITVHHEDGTPEVKEIKPIEGSIILDPDVRAFFPDSESVNDALRNLIRLIPTERKQEAD